MALLQKFHPAFLACTATGRKIEFVHIAYIFSRVIHFVNFGTYCGEVRFSSLIAQGLCCPLYSSELELLSQ
jgi:predicted phosphatase